MALIGRPFIRVGVRVDFMASPNQPTESAAELRIDSASFAEALDVVALDSPAVPVKILFDDDSMSVWTHDSARTIQVMMDDLPVKGLTAKDKCSLVVSPDSMAQLLKAKFDGTIEVKQNADSRIDIRAANGSSVTITSAAEEECNTIPDHWRLGMDEGWVTFPMLDNQRATTRALISVEELRRGLVDMKVSGAPYVVFRFNPGEVPSFSQSGHWQSKATTSRTVVEATVEGEGIEVCFTTALASILSRFPGSEKVMVQKHTDAPFFVVHSVGKEGNIQVIATEAVREA